MNTTKKITYRTNGGSISALGLSFQNRASLVLWLPLLMKDNSYKLCPEILGDAFIYGNTGAITFQMKQSGWNLESTELKKSNLTNSDSQSIIEDIKASIGFSRKIILVTNKEFTTRKDGTFSYDTVDSFNVKDLKETIISKKQFKKLGLEEKEVNDLKILYYPIILSEEEMQAANKINFNGKTLDILEFGELMEKLLALYDSINSTILKSHKPNDQLYLSDLDKFSLKSKDVELRILGRFKGGAMERDEYIDKILHGFRTLKLEEKEIIKLINLKRNIANKFEYINSLLGVEVLEDDFVRILKLIRREYE